MALVVTFFMTHLALEICGCCLGRPSTLALTQLSLLHSRYHQKFSKTSGRRGH